MPVQNISLALSIFTAMFLSWVPISHPSLGKGQEDVISFILVMQLLDVKIATPTCQVLNLLLQFIWRYPWPPWNGLVTSCFLNGILTCFRLEFYLRVHFKVLVLMYKVLFGLDPVYLWNYLSLVFCFKSLNYLEFFQLRCLKPYPIGQGTDGRLHLAV